MKKKRHLIWFKMQVVKMLLYQFYPVFTPICWGITAITVLCWVASWCVTLAFLVCQLTDHRRYLTGVCFPSPSTGRLGLHRQEMGLFWEWRVGIQEEISKNRLFRKPWNLLPLNQRPNKLHFCSHCWLNWIKANQHVCIYTHKNTGVNIKSTLALMSFAAPVCAQHTTWIHSFVCQ